MTSLRWLAWPSPRRTDGASVTYAHAFKYMLLADASRYGPTLSDSTLCGAPLPTGQGVVRLATPSDAIERCRYCDQACRDMGAPHPVGKSKLQPWEYDPVHLFEEWASL